jgi:hypothetical protein
MKTQYNYLSFLCDVREHISTGHFSPLLLDYYRPQGKLSLRQARQQ